MLLPIKPICDKNKIRKDGTSLIFIQYCFSAESKTLLNTELAIPPNYWHKKLNRVRDDIPPNFGVAVNLNNEINRQMQLAEDIISHALKSPGGDVVAFVKETFNPHFDVSITSFAVLCSCNKANTGLPDKAPW